MRGEQLTLFSTRRHTRYTRSIEQLIQIMRGGFVRLPYLEKRLLELGIFKEEEIDFLWGHSIYGDPHAMPVRDAYLRQIWNPVLTALELLNREGSRSLPQARRQLAEGIIELRNRIKRTL